MRFFFMFQERFGSGKRVQSRVQSAPPLREMERRPTTSSQNQQPLVKPATPNSEQLSRILEERISTALTGPDIYIRRDSSTDESNVRRVGRRASLKRSTALVSQDLVPLDAEELSMLRSIAQSRASVDMSTGRTESLRRHEYEDLSDEEQKITKRRPSLIRQFEHVDSFSLPSVSQSHGRSSSAGSRIAHMELRSAGFRHEKIRSTGSQERMKSQTSKDSKNGEFITGLIFDPDFNVYYSPSTDIYYRLNSFEKQKR